jgi:hypothetical protein
VSQVEIASLRASPGHQEIRGLKQVKLMRDYLFEEDKEDLKSRDIHPEESTTSTGHNERGLIDTLQNADFTPVAGHTAAQLVLPSSVAIQQLDLSDIKKIKMR